MLPFVVSCEPVEQSNHWEYIRENYFKNACWLSMETLETALAAVLKKIADCSEMTQSMAVFHWVKSFRMKPAVKISANSIPEVFLHQPS